MSTLNVGTNVQISGTSRKITGVLGAPGIIPTGAVIYTASNTGTGSPVGSLPPGYLPCDGAYYSTSLYPELYAAIRDTFNSNASLVNPATGAALAQPPVGNFRVPMLQGLFVRCWDGPSYTSIDPVNSGRIFGSYQVDDFKSHTHNINNQTANGPNFLAFSRSDLNPTATDDGTGYVQGTLGNDRIFSIVNSGGTANANITVTNSQTFPRNLALFAIIKY
jgi:hypothetical protein